MISSKIHASIICIAAMTTLTCSPSAIALCYSFNQAPANTLNFGATLGNESLSIPQDAPIGTVIFKQSLNVANQRFICDSLSTYGLHMNPALGVPSSSTYPLGKTGLSFRIATNNSGLPYLPRPYSALQPQLNYSTGMSAFTLEIIKTAELLSENQVPAGLLGNFQAGDLVLDTFNLINPLKLNTASCQTPAVQVQMGDDYRLMEFDNAGDAPRTIKFNIGLNQCQSGINKVTYSLKANSQVIDQQKGMVALNPSSTAKGIGLKLMNETGQPIALGNIYPFNGFNTTNKNFNIPLSAAYYRLTDSILEAGTADTSVTFIVNYL